MKKNKFIVYAHRGASEYAPENTFSSFYMGLLMGANGIETDVRRSKDGTLILFHDRNLERVMGKEGAAEDYTYDELVTFRVKHPQSGREDIVVRLEDFLHYFSAHDLTLAIELKGEGIEADTYALIKKYGLEDRAIVTSFRLDYLINLKKLYPEASLGYLTEDFDEELLSKMKEIGIGQLCPRATNLTAEKVAAWHGLGFNVRAWGVKDALLMKHACECGVDGMTVNFPDRLIEYIIHKG